MSDATTPASDGLDWAQARKHLGHVAGVYFMLPDNAGAFGLVVMASLRDRFNAGERTPELHAAMLATE